MAKINTTVLMSGADYFSDNDAINSLMNPTIPVDIESAIKEHQSIINAFKLAGIKVITVAPPSGCQDGIYTANWALVKNNKALMSRLPNKRKPEESYAKQIISNLGLETVELPPEIRAFSGQGDSLVCGDIVFCQSPYRTSIEAHIYLKSYLGFKEVIELQTKPARWLKIGPSKINKITGWPDSPTYDLDLALAILRPASSTTKPLIAYCPSVFKPTSRKILRQLDSFDKIEVAKEETLSAFALNLVSTGETVIMNSGAPRFKAAIESYGLKVMELKLPELKKGGGSIRCCSLSLDNN